jgi:hypothetical protein
VRRKQAPRQLLFSTLSLLENHANVIPPRNSFPTSQRSAKTLPVAPESDRFDRWDGRKAAKWKNRVTRDLGIKIYMHQ